MAQRFAIYLDANAGLPLKPQVKEKIIEWCEHSADYGNPSSVHVFGRKSKQAILRATDSVLASIGAGDRKRPIGKLYFTSSGTEANQWIIRSALKEDTLWISNSLEHDSVQAEFARQQSNTRFLSVPVENSGQLGTAEFLKKFLKQNSDSPILISQMWVNHETGVINDLTALIEMRRRHQNLLIHVDCAQGWGKLEFSSYLLEADYLTFSGPKIGSLHGVGCAWVKNGAPLVSLFPGHQQHGLRGGTEFLLPILSVGWAAEGLLDHQQLKATQSIIALKRNRLEQELVARLGVEVNGGSLDRVSNTLNITIEGISSQSLISRVDLRGFAISSGSACSAGTGEPSPVLMAMGRTQEQALASVRISLKGNETDEELQNFVEVFCDEVRKLRDYS